MGVAKVPVCNLPLLYTPCPCAVLIIPLPGTSLPGFASRHGRAWFQRIRKKVCYRNQFVSSCRSCPFLSLAHGGSVKAPVCNCFPEQLYSAYRRDRIIACIPRKNSTASTPYWYRAWHSACSIKPLFPRCVERITL